MFFKKLKKVAAKDKPKSAKFIAPLEMPHRRAHQRGISETSLQASKKGDEVTKEISSIKKKDAVTTKSDAATSSSIGNKERHAAERRQKLKELAIKKNENKANLHRQNCCFFCWCYEELSSQKSKASVCSPGGFRAIHFQEEVFCQREGFC